MDGLTGQFRPLNGGDDYNYGPLNYYQTPNVRWTAGAFVNYDVNSHVNVYMNVMYMSNSSSGADRPERRLLPEFVRSVRRSAADGAGARDAVHRRKPRRAGQSVRDLQRRELPRSQHGHRAPQRRGWPSHRHLHQRLDTRGARREGRLGDPQGAWTYNAYAQHGTVDSQNGNLNYLSNNNIDQALNVLPGPTGPVCGGPSSPVNNGPLVGHGYGVHAQFKVRTLEPLGSERGNASGTRLPVGPAARER